MKIGFIDYYLDEWHANNYPQWIRDASSGELEVAYAYGMIDSPLEGGMTTDEWCEKYGIARCASIEELVEKSDVLVVLSPDNCEMHEQLCQVPLRSGKRTYIDKTFAPDKATAQRIFAIAEENGTPCYSTSALRFAEEYRDIQSEEIAAINSWGPGSYEIYSIHQLEPLMMLMKAPAKRVLYLPGESWHCMAIEFENGKKATISQYAGGSPFMMNICSGSGNRVVQVNSDFFHDFIVELVDFFNTGVEKVPHEETIAIMAVREAGLKAQQVPGEWVNL